VRGDDVNLVRRIRVAPLHEIAADPGLLQLAARLDALAAAYSAALLSIDREIKRSRPRALSGPAMYGGIAASAGGLVDALATTASGVPWISLAFAVGGVLAGGIGASDTRRENTLRGNRNFERKALRRDLVEITEARVRLRQALALLAGDDR
jgi:hypothetical protein